jgi:4-hydroxybenzoate polyprenyltransferase
MFSKVKSILISMRPKQWFKNFFLFVGLVFSKNLFQAGLFIKVSEGFILFCLVASSIYIFNDIHDRESDRKHPEKCQRPLSKGTLRVSEAYMVSTLLSAIAFVFAFMMDRTFFVILLAYLILNLAYSLKVKQIVILDIMFIASGYVLRIFAGTTLAGVISSDWLVICIITLSLFLGLSKRRNELVLMGENAGHQRKVLKEYNIYFLDQMISIVTACTIMSYILYTVSAETVDRFGTKNLVLTIPFVLFGIFRYFYLIYLKKMIDNPVDLVLKDFPFLLNILLWFIAVMIIIY